MSESKNSKSIAKFISNEFDSCPLGVVKEAGIFLHGSETGAFNMNKLTYRDIQAKVIYNRYILTK